MSTASRAIGAALVVGVAAAGGWALGRADGASSAHSLPAGVETAIVARGDVAIAVSLTGVVVPRVRLPVRAEVDGRVARVRVAAGALVNAGDPICELDSTSATMDLTRATLDRRLAEIDAGLGERQQIALDLARLTERDARQRLARHVVRAPARGRIVELNVAPGDPAGPSSDPVAVVMPGDTWDVEVEADEFDVAAIRIGAAASAVVPAHSPVPCLGEVRTEPRIVRVRSGVGSPALFRFRVGLTCEGSPRASGLSAYVEVERERRDDVLLVPLGAIVRHEGQEHVVVATGDAFELRPVTIGLADASVAEVTAGLAEHDRILSGPEPLLRAVARTSR